MGLLDKVMFWKKEPKLDLDPSLDLGPDPSMPQAPEQPPAFGHEPAPGMQQGFPQPSYQQPYEQPRVISDPVQNQASYGNTGEKNLEIVSMKLDNIKAAIENMNQRLINIERIAMDSQRQEPRRRQW